MRERLTAIRAKLHERADSALAYARDYAIPLALCAFVAADTAGIVVLTITSYQREGRIAVLENQVRDLEGGRRGDRWRLSAQMVPWSKALASTNADLVVPDPREFSDE